MNDAEQAAVRWLLECIEGHIYKCDHPDRAGYPYHLSYIADDEVSCGVVFAEGALPDELLPFVEEEPS